MNDTHGTTTTSTASPLGRTLLAVAILLALVAALRDFTAPWEDGLRGENAAVYEDVFVRNFLRYGLGVTHAAPAFVYEVNGAPVCTWHWHHPAAYPLYLTAWAAVLGHHEWVLRLAQLVVFLPGILSLWLLLRRATDETFAGCGAVLFATSPMIAYFGPMVVHDGAVLTLGLSCCASFASYADAPSRRGLVRTAALFFAATQLDFLAHFWGVAMFVLALRSSRRREALRAIALLFVVSLMSLSVVALHYATIFDSPLHYLRMLLDETGNANARAPSAGEVRTAVDDALFGYGAWPVWAMAAAGASATGLAVLPHRRDVAFVGVALLLPGLLSCLLSLRHFVDHAFWSMPTIAGAAVFAAVLPFVALRSLASARGMSKFAAFALLLAALAVAAHGTFTTHALVERFRPRTASFAAMAQEAAVHVQGCALALTNHDVPMRPFLPGLLFLGKVRTGDDLDRWLTYGRQQGVQGEIAFVLDLAAAEPTLVARLDALSPAVRCEHVAVYRFRP